MLTAAPTATRQILQTQDLTVSFDGFKALDRLNFSLEEGELRVVIGPQWGRQDYVSRCADGQG